MAHKCKLTALHLQVIPTAKKHYALTIDCRSYCLPNQSSRYDEMISNYITNLFGIVISQMKAHLFSRNDPIPIIGSLPTFTLACSSYHFKEETVMWALPYFVHKRLANALMSCMYVEDSLARFPASICNEEQQSQKLLRPYLEIVRYYLKTFATDWAVAEYDTSILRYMQPLSVTPLQYADNINIKSSK